MIIELTQLCRTYDTPTGPVHALRAVDFQVEAGAMIALIGPSGSGKTTLLNLLGALDQPSSGRLSVLGCDLVAADAEARARLRRRIGFIFQSFALLPTLTAYENVELGLRLAANTPRALWDEQVRASLEAVALTPWIHHRPYELSGGQQQRVAIARALVARPELILADEPTGDLDGATGQCLLALLQHTAAEHGTTIVMATHDAQAQAAAGMTYRLADGVLTPEHRAAERSLS